MMVVKDIESFKMCIKVKDDEMCELNKKTDDIIQVIKNLRTILGEKDKEIGALNAKVEELTHILEKNVLASVEMSPI